MARLVAEREDVVPLLAEVFRRYGFEGATLARITEGTKLGKGSIYHFFPGGKDDMAEAVLALIDDWFAANVFAPLRGGDAQGAITRMFDETRRYFDAGNKVCLVGMFALGHERDRFSSRVQGYFKAWIDALAGALRHCGHGAREARQLAEETVAGIQGALVLARALQEPKTFEAALARLQARLQ
ncbi:TetR/AcrR family transcriptional regulator [Pseudoduganella ginsengisoli]|uniref:TetR family transcriptional regulator n=1 Tax=Pseudoduganella ginsengisoli TaxID=1462440 RepID=A0A6L6PX31_9BURK|nr:TetR/AcrR family transcriptional regulator [Pseudoduganella ginsengisoli]MTW01704.1 TetR family transcriptional regulator [Pseudoduganella ginsengisoli]